MFWFFLYWIIGIIVVAYGFYHLEDELTVEKLFLSIPVGLIWPLCILAFFYAKYGDTVIFKKKR